jgi:hypothetical protein
MAYILGDQRDQGGPEAKRLWDAYQIYLLEMQPVFPPGAHGLAVSDWYYGFSDHRAPHDGWLEWAKFEEPAMGDRNEKRHLSLRVRLLGAYHDQYIEFFYPVVYAYNMSSPKCSGGHADWRYDEFRVTPEGHLLHEIEWAGSPGVESRWIIEASDVEFAVYPLEGS